MTRGRQRGFTLIELMVALLVSSLLVGMILAIFSRMSLAYRGQQQIAGVQQVLAAARAAIELDAKQVGLGMPQGFKTVDGPHDPIQVINSNNAPDQIALFYADTSIQAVVRDFTAWPTSVQVDQVTGLSDGMLVVLSTASTMQAPVNPGTDPDIAAYDTCVLQIAPNGISGTTISFAQTAPWGQAGNTHCTNRTPNRTMLYHLVAHAYRIDNTTGRGALQLSTTGNLLGNAEVWSNLAYGFSDLQVALRAQDGTGLDLDDDGDVTRNWYSGSNQSNVTSAPSTLLQMTISLLAHTDRNIEGITTRATPSFIAPDPSNPTGPAIVDNNQLGDRPSTVLPTAPPWPDPLLPGSVIYRYTTFQVDFRNLGIGQQ